MEQQHEGHGFTRGRKRNFILLEHDSCLYNALIYRETNVSHCDRLMKIQEFIISQYLACCFVN